MLIGGPSRILLKLKLKFERSSLINICYEITIVGTSQGVLECSLPEV